VNAAITYEWHSLFPLGIDTSWLTVSTYAGHYTGINPDGAWLPGGGNFGGTAYTEQRKFIEISKRPNHNTTQNNIAHEVSHATKFFFPSSRLWSTF